MEDTIKDEQQLINPTIDSYEKLCSEQKYTVDKTELIRAILFRGAKRFVITRPRKWGKTLNLLMIKKFLEIDVDRNGNILSSQKKIDHFEKLSILKNEFDNKEVLKTLISEFSINKDPKLNSMNQEKSELIEIFSNIEQELEQIVLKQEKLFELKNEVFQCGEQIASLTDQLKKQKSKALEQIERQINLWKSEQSSNLQIMTKYFYSPRQYISQYPVIFISLKNNGIWVDDIKTALSQTFEEHSYMIEVLSQKLEKEQSTAIKKLIQSDISEFKNILQCKDYRIIDSIFFLSQLLSKHFSKQAYVLIDDYDSILTHHYGKDTYQPALMAIRGMFHNSLKNNEHVFGAVITGTMRIGKGDLFSVVNNFIQEDLIDTEFDEYFGFTETEVKKLIQEVLKDSKGYIAIPDLKGWYNGYNIGKQTIYNPWSIMHCLRSYQLNLNILREYWIDSGSTNLIENSLKNLSDTLVFTQLLHTNQIQQKIHKWICFDNLLADVTKDAFFGLLLQSGYLTFGENKSILKIPNIEVKNYFWKYLLPILQKKIDQVLLNSPELLKIFKDISGDDQQCQKAFQQILNTFCHPINSPECNFQGMPLLINYIYKNPDYIYGIEDETRFFTKCDGKFTPCEQTNQNNYQNLPIIINDYKQIINDDKSGCLMVNVCQQYLDCAFKSYKKNSYLKQNNIIMRSIVFYRKGNMKDWNVDVEGIEHTKEQAQQLQNLFQENNKLLKNYQILSGRGNQGEVENQRNIFLKKHNYNSLAQLLQKHSIKNLTHRQVNQFSVINNRSLNRNYQLCNGLKKSIIYYGFGFLKNII